jgi:hypothetical protein
MHAIRIFSFFLAAPLVGCIVATDVINPDVFTALGADPNLTSGVTGRTVVNFENNTGSEVLFYAFEAPSASDVTQDSRNFSVLVESGGIRNEVLDCPLGIFGPGGLNADFSYSDVAATIITDTGDGTDVTYTGSVLQVSLDFKCGDVINVRLDEDAAGEAVISVQVFPS